MVKENYCRIRIYIFTLIISSFFSCSNDNYKLDPKTCDVEIEGLQEDSDNEEIGLKTITIKRLKDTPGEILGYNLKVENLEHSLINIIEERFEFVKSGWDRKKGFVSGVVEGMNRFTAESFGGNPVKGWVQIDRISGGNVDDRSEEYSEVLEDEYPLYTKYKDEIEFNIKPNKKNRVKFKMEPVNGRLAIVVENNDWWNKLNVYINGEGVEVLYRGAACYILNDDSVEGTELKVQIDIYERIWGNWSNYEYSKSQNRTHTIEAGENKTRLIEVR